MGRKVQSMLYWGLPARIARVGVVQWPGTH